MKSSTYESIKFDRFVFGSTCRSIRLRQSNRTAKVRRRFRRRTFHVPNLMHTLGINYIYYILPIILHVQANCHAQRSAFKDGGKREILFILPEEHKIYMFNMQRVLLLTVLDFREQRRCRWMESQGFCRILRAVFSGEDGTRDGDRPSCWPTRSCRRQF